MCLHYTLFKFRDTLCDVRLRCQGCALWAAQHKAYSTLSRQLLCSSNTAQLERDVKGIREIFSSRGPTTAGLAAETVSKQVRLATNMRDAADKMCRREHGTVIVDEYVKKGTQKFMDANKVGVAWNGGAKVRNKATKDQTAEKRKREAEEAGEDGTELSKRRGGKDGQVILPRHLRGPDAQDVKKAKAAKAIDKLQDDAAIPLNVDEDEDLDLDPAFLAALS